MRPSSSPNSIANVRPSVVRTVQAEIYIAIFGCSSKMPLRGENPIHKKSVHVANGLSTNFLELDKYNIQIIRSALV